MTTPPPRPGPDSAAPTAPTWRSRYVPAVLDAIAPGLGHLVAGRRKLAAIFGIPFLALILVSLMIVATTSGGRLAAEAINVFWLLIGVQGVVLVWRVLAAGTSLFAPELPRLRVLDAIPIAILFLLLAGPQVVLGYVTNEARIATDEIFVGQTVTPGAWNPQGSVAPDPSDFRPGSVDLGGAFGRAIGSTSLGRSGSRSCWSASTRASVATRPRPTR